MIFFIILYLFLTFLDQFCGVATDSQAVIYCLAKFFQGVARCVVAEIFDPQSNVCTTSDSHSRCCVSALSWLRISFVGFFVYLSVGCRDCCQMIQSVLSMSLL